MASATPGISCAEAGFRVKSFPSPGSEDGQWKVKEVCGKCLKPVSKA